MACEKSSPLKLKSKYLVIKYTDGLEQWDAVREATVQSVTGASIGMYSSVIVRKKASAGKGKFVPFNAIVHSLPMGMLV